MITIGHDAEVFLKEIGTGKLIPATGLIGGRKGAPLPFRGGGLLEDGVAAELNINPANTETKFVRNTQTLLKELETLVKPRNLTFQIQSVACFDKKVLNRPQMFEFGCEPDYNVWTLEENDTTKQLATLIKQDKRVAGGHIHIGILNKRNQYMYEGNISSRAFLVYACELFIGLPLTIFDPDRERKSYYGASGAHRLKPYGVEYRVPSNFWLSDPALMGLIYNLATFAAGSMQNLSGISSLLKKFQIATQIGRCTLADPQNPLSIMINKGDKESALAVIANYYPIDIKNIIMQA